MVSMWRQLRLDNVPIDIRAIWLLDPVVATGCSLEAHRTRAPRMSTAELGTPVRYRVTGMDCPDCAAKIENTARKTAEVEAVRVSIASQGMTLRRRDDSVLRDRSRRRNSEPQGQANE